MLLQVSAANIGDKSYQKLGLEELVVTYPQFLSRAKPSM